MSSLDYFIFVIHAVAINSMLLKAESMLGYFGFEPQDLEGHDMNSIKKRKKRTMKQLIGIVE